MDQHCSFNISSPNGSSLLTTAAAALGNLGLGNWTSLVTSDGGVNFDGNQAGNHSALPAGVGSQGEFSLLDALEGSADGGGMTVQRIAHLHRTPRAYPRFVPRSRCGHGTHFSDQLTLPFDESFDIDIIPDFFIHVTAVANVDATIAVATTHRDCADAIAPLYSGHSLDLSKVLDGLYYRFVQRMPTSMARSRGWSDGLRHRGTQLISGSREA